jgi:tetratricopeptide (TPR) repeat protein
MDIISKSIITALTTDPLAENAAIAYQNLRSALYKEFGQDSDLADALEQLQKKPDSAGRQAALGEELLAVRAGLDPTVRSLAQNLLNKLEPDQYRPSHPMTGTTVPLQHPPRPDRLFDNRPELDEVVAQLKPGHVVSLCGPVGIGKSELAAAVVWKAAPKAKPPRQFRNGIIYHSFHRQPRADIVLEEIARIFGEEPIPSPYDATQRALANRQALLVFDGAEYCDDLSGVLAMRGNCGVLITGRTCPENVDAQIQVPALEPDIALQLLTDVAGRLPRETARNICELLGYLPLAIRLTGAQLKAQNINPTDYLAWLQSTDLPALGPEQRQQTCLDLVMANNLGQISEFGQQALAVIGLLAPVPFDQDVITKTLAIQPSHGLFSAIRGLFKQQTARQQTPQVRIALRELENFGLIHIVEGKYQVSHPYIHTYAQKKLTPPAKSVRRLATYFMALSWEQSMLGVSGDMVLDSNRPHFMRIMTECVEWNEWEAAHGLAAAVEDYLDRQGYLADRVTANEIGLMAAWQLGRPSAGAWLGNLGDTYRTMGHAKWAIEHFEKALETARQTGDRHGEGNSLGNLGLAYRDMGQIDQALEYLRGAYAIFEDVRSPSAGLVADWLSELEEWDED